MSAWGKRQNRFNRSHTQLRFEQLERRELLSTIPITSGTSVRFVDGDGTKVVVKLTGGGSGSFTLTNGLTNHGWIDSMTLSGTGATSQLSITASGGQDNVSTIRLLTVNPLTPGTALAAMNTRSINVASGGLLTFNGNVGSMALNNVNHGGSIVVYGNLGKYTGVSFHSGTTLDVQSTLGSFNVQSFGTGSALATLSAQTLTKLTVTQQLNGAVVDVGPGGVSSAFLNMTLNAALSSGGNIGTVVVQNSASNTGIAANRRAGSDGVLGTLDDYTFNPSATPTITSVQFNGVVSPNGNGVQVITTSSTMPSVTGAGSANVEVIDNAISQFIPLQIEQAAAGITGFDDDEIWIAVYGQEIPAPPPGVIPNPGSSYYLDATQLNGSGASATPKPISTSTLVVGPNTPNQAILPSFTLEQWKNALSAWGSNLQFPVPTLGNQYTGRIVISYGAPVQAQVSNAAPYTVAAPSPASSIDTSTGTFYDFLEFTVNNATQADGGLSLDMDTSQVDAFGAPMALQFFTNVAATPADAYDVTFQGTVANNSNVITNVTNMGQLQVGQPVVNPAGFSGIQPGSLIDSIDTVNNTIVLSKPATASSPLSPGYTILTAENAGPVGVAATRGDLFDPANTDSLTYFLQHQLDQNNQYARPFLQSAAPFQTTSPNPVNNATLVSGTLTIYADSVANLQANDTVLIYGVGGIPTAQGVYTVASVNPGANTFTVTGVSGSGTYVSGGVWMLAITEASAPTAITNATLASGMLTIYTAGLANLKATDTVTIYGVNGIAAANATFEVATVDPSGTYFTVTGVVGSGTYVSGGTWQEAINGATLPANNTDILIAASSVAGLNDGDLIQIVNVPGMTAANGFFFIDNVDPVSKTFILLDSNGAGQTFTPISGAGALAGTWTTYTTNSNLRLVSPDDIIGALPAPTSPNQLNNYYNAIIDEFFLTYLPTSVAVTGMDGVQRYGKGATMSLQSSKSGAAVNYTGTVQQVALPSGATYGLVLTDGNGGTFVIFYPFSNVNSPSTSVYKPKFPTANPLPWLQSRSLQMNSASQMVFGCDGVFADNAFRAADYNVQYPNWSAILGDLENSIASAFNRGIALNDASTWGDRSTWFQQTYGTQPANLPSTPSPERAALYGAYNYWVEYWHQDGIAVNDLAYAFPYDDKYGTSTNLQQNNVGLAQILLNQWSSALQTTDTTTTFGTLPASPTQGGSVTVSATVAGGATPTGTVTFFIDGVPINSNNYSATPPQQPVALNGSGVASLTANLPALPDGNLTRTYTLTAVYSGDSTHKPSIAYTPLKLTGVNGDFLMGSTGTPTAGLPITVSSTSLPGGVYNGTLAFSINGTSLGTINIGSASFSTSLTIPSTLAAGYYNISALFTPLSGGPYTGLLGINVSA